jgi:hypothetical protein
VKKVKGVKYGARHAQVATIKTNPAGKLPTYEELLSLGGLRKCGISITMASGELYMDDRLALKVDEFSSGICDLETGDVDDEVLAQILGAKIETGTILYKSDDVPPRVGISFYAAFKATEDAGTLKTGDIYYRGVYLPVAQAQIGDDTYETQENSIKFGSTNTKFTIFASNDNTWKKTSILKTEEEAVAWCDKMLGKTPAGGGSGGGS